MQCLGTMNQPTISNAQSAILNEQRRRYEGGFYRRHRWRWLFRDDCRYRWHRLRDILQQIGFATRQRTVLEIGFGSGDLLLRFPTSCRLMGLELSRAAVEAVQADPRLASYREHWLDTVGPDGSLPAPPWSADLLLCSHVLEHVPDDRRLLQQACSLVRPGGLLALFVPLETPGFDPKHVRCYTTASFADLVQSAGLELLHVESNYRICCGPARWADHPARHGWPVLKWIEAVRNVALTLIPHATTLAIEEVLLQGGVPATQVMAIAERPRTLAA